MDLDSGFLFISIFDLDDDNNDDNIDNADAAAAAANVENKNCHACMHACYPYATLGLCYIQYFLPNISAYLPII